jgi:hypothetical protein
MTGVSLRMECGVPRARMIFEKQWLHASLLVALLAGLGVVSRLDGARSGRLWGVTTPV